MKPSSITHVELTQLGANHRYSNSVAVLQWPTYQRILNLILATLYTSKQMCHYVYILAQPLSPFIGIDVPLNLYDIMLVWVQIAYNNYYAISL